MWSISNRCTSPLRQNVGSGRRRWSSRPWSRISTRSRHRSTASVSGGSVPLLAAQSSNARTTRRLARHDTRQRIVTRTPPPEATTPDTARAGRPDHRRHPRRRDDRGSRRPWRAVATPSLPPVRPEFGKVHSGRQRRAVAATGLSRLPPGLGGLAGANGHHRAPGPPDVRAYRRPRLPPLRRGHVVLRVGRAVVSGVRYRPDPLLARPVDDELVAATAATWPVCAATSPPIRPTDADNRQVHSSVFAWSRQMGPECRRPLVDSGHVECSRARERFRGDSRAHPRSVRGRAGRARARLFEPDRSARRPATDRARPGATDDPPHRAGHRDAHPDRPPGPRAAATGAASRTGR